MDKKILEVKLGDALEHGFVPKDIIVPEGAGKFVVIDKEGEDERITIAFRTADFDSAGTIGRIYNHQYIYTLDEVVKLLEEYGK